ncbi:MAG: Rpn family recombination-promoting nuclease/putative transposase [Deltaproteobacteria bacterium]|nr:Rpn family recombination-promoting nuclease/putative transposase [Deltaproteobacteria bacterium]
MFARLDPKLDVVFKLLFAHPRNRDLLLSLLTAVLRPTSPISELEVLNPEVSKDAVADKGIVLDIHVRLEDGRHVDVEMQSTKQLTFSSRALLPRSDVLRQSASRAGVQRPEELREHPHPRLPPVAGRPLPLHLPCQRRPLARAVLGRDRDPYR